MTKYKMDWHPEMTIKDIHALPQFLNYKKVLENEWEEREYLSEKGVKRLDREMNRVKRLQNRMLRSLRVCHQPGPPGRSYSSGNVGSNERHKNVDHNSVAKAIRQPLKDGDSLRSSQKPPRPQQHIKESGEEKTNEQDDSFNKT